jgi:hypothetical protein
MNLPDFLTEHAYGSIRVTGHRIDLLHLVHYTLAEGESVCTTSRSGVEDTAS